MGSFTYEGFMGPDWQYEEPATPYASVLPNAAYGHAPGIATYASHEAGNGQAVMYMPQQYEPSNTSPVVFQVPRAPASASRPAERTRQPQRPPSDSESDCARRIKRTRTACEECRKRKQKCDGGEPCQPCSEQGTSCKYRDVRPTKKDDTMEKMLQLAERYNTTLASLNDDIDVMNNTLRSIEARLNHSMPQAPRSTVERRHAATQQDRSQSTVRGGYCYASNLLQDRRGSSSTSSRSS
ncbi:hypothetical protein AC578_7909 [Pseudocercospora eumusae]|uniref:Zn(2)-C6 fungal-type domain-containing protein n=1 Tax=Pseudocercospora eumusae TaxID=321146 RepID=A0A139HPE2_9PEZI|nr:hypothetical protein AC578_7909 [Pseudocercospora eumusae]